MSRLRRPRPAELDVDQRTLYDSIVGGPRSAGPALFALTDDEGRLEGPFNAMLASPPVGSALQSLGSAIRYRSQLSDRVREMAILAIATHWSSDFERHAHEAVGRHIGLSEAEMLALRAGSSLELADEYEAAALAAVRALLGHADLTDDEFLRVSTVLGEGQLFELTTLVGYYATLALQLRVFRVDASPSTSRA